MVCCGLKTTSELKLGKNLNPDIALETLKLMLPGGRRYGFDNTFGPKAQVYVDMPNGTRVVVDVASRYNQGGAVVRSSDIKLAEQVREALLMHYATVVNAVVLRQQGFRINIEKDKDRIRLVGER